MLEWVRTTDTIAVVTQIFTVRAAFPRLDEKVRRDHVTYCVEHAIADCNEVTHRRKRSVLMEVVGQAERLWLLR